jgi:lysophospholipase L1-like esterase
MLGVATALAVMASTPAFSASYYLALGDSLAHGVGATSGNEYVDDIFAFEQQTIAGLQLVNLSCSGETTSTMMNGGICTYATGSQLGDAEAFLAAHSGEVAFVTIDIGGNDVAPCLLSIPVNAGCVESALPTATADLDAILSGLRTAGGAVPVVGLMYYDPVLAYWLQGGAGQTAAHDSVKLAKSVNSALKKSYRKHRVRVANGEKTFATTKWALTGSYANQTVPINVAQVCAWTLMCTVNDIHANDAGHAALAGAFEPQIAKALARP